jgi:hypothetical protein
MKSSYFVINACLVVNIEDSLLNFVVDFSGRVDEGFLHVGRSLSRRLHEDEAVLASKRLAFFSLDVTSCLKVTAKVRGIKAWILQGGGGGSFS